MLPGELRETIERMGATGSRGADCGKPVMSDGGATSETLAINSGALRIFGIRRDPQTVVTNMAGWPLVRS